ncbi:MAG: Tex family protein [Erysipelotrichaceae bacterium]
MKELIEPIAKILKVKTEQVERTLALLQDSNTVPFIARYRKEMTGGLDEDQIRVIEEQYSYQLNLKNRKEDVARLIEQQGKLDDEIKTLLANATKLSQVEDIYRPYQQKRKTRATDAIANGLKPLGEYILSLPLEGNVNEEAKKYLNDKITTVEEALQGAKDIIAEVVSDNLDVRNKIVIAMQNNGKIKTTEKKKHEDEMKVYKMYYDYEERIATIANHRVMAIDRGEKEKVISVNISFDDTYIIQWTNRLYLKREVSICDNLVVEAIADGLKRLAFPSIMRGIRNELSERAHTASIEVFSSNLENLLLQPPLKKKMILGLDPAFRTGCKLAVIDETGKALKVSVIYPHAPVFKVKESKDIVLGLLNEFPINVIAIGNGTASRESESFVAELIRENNLDVQYSMVSEAGASVYSASKLAKEEFPDLHVEQRSAISIARRMQDPLSELIKIDPQSIGVGQYQHDLPQAQLKERLEFVVSKAVNRVGVNVNTASATLLKNISGLNGATAKSIVDYREENGEILNRTALKKIPKLGAKAFTQAAGFLRIEDGKELLDATSIHPESYKLTKQILKLLGIKEKEMGTQIARDAIANINIDNLIEEVQSDKYTVEDILDSISLPLRDYRDRYDAPLLRSDVLTFNDLNQGDTLQGIVRNVVDFGGFVDIGLKEDGLIHISQLGKRVNHPSEILSVGDIVTVSIFKIDEEKHKVQLSLVA